MQRYGISQLPVARHETADELTDIVGSISERSLLDRVFRNPDALNDDVAVAMQPPSATVDAGASVDEVFAELTGSGGAVVVGRAGKPVAIITRSDLLEFLAAQPDARRRLRPIRPPGMLLLGGLAVGTRATGARSPRGLPWRAVTTTAPTISTAPASVVGAGRSSRISAPSATATSGFTYWWVTTCEIGALLQKPGVRAESDHRSHDREVRPTLRPVPGWNASAPSCARLAGDEPRAHEARARRRASRRPSRRTGRRGAPAVARRTSRETRRATPRASRADRPRPIRRSTPPGPTTSARPTRPTPAASTVARGTRSPASARQTTICSGTEPAIIAATPESILVSATCTRPTPHAEQRDAQTRRRERFAAVDAKRSPRDCEDRGEDCRCSEEARSGREERRQRAHGELDPEVRRSPDEVDDPERSPELDPPAAHDEWSARRRLGVRSPGGRGTQREHLGCKRWESSIPSAASSGAPTRR